MGDFLGNSEDIFRLDCGLRRFDQTSFKCFSGEPFGGSLLYDSSQSEREDETPGQGQGLGSGLVYGLGQGFEEIPEMPIHALDGPQFDYFS